MVTFQRDLLNCLHKKQQQYMWGQKLMWNYKANKHSNIIIWDIQKKKLVKFTGTEHIIALQDLPIFFSGLLVQTWICTFTTTTSINKEINGPGLSEQRHSTIIQPSHPAGTLQTKKRDHWAQYLEAVSINCLLQKHLFTSESCVIRVEKELVCGNINEVGVLRSNNEHYFC